MSYKILKQIDPRDRLQKARRKDLENAVRARDLPWKPGMSAEVMRGLLRQEGLQDASVPEPKIKDFAEMSVFELRAVCKRMGIETAKTDSKAALLEKLSVQDAA